MNEKEDQIMNALMGIGITEHDAMVITDCIVTRKSCSWVNIDPVDERMLQDLRQLIAKNNYGITVNIQAVPTRSKFIWEIRMMQ